MKTSTTWYCEDCKTEGHWDWSTVVANPYGKFNGVNCMKCGSPNIRRITFIPKYPGSGMPRDKDGNPDPYQMLFKENPSEAVVERLDSLTPGAGQSFYRGTPKTLLG